MGLGPTLVYLVFAEPAHAAEASTASQADRWSETRLYAQGRFGLGSPIGLAGVSAELSLGRYASVWAGLGHNAFGVQAAAMGHLRLPIAGALALTAGLGLSRGAYEYRTNWIDADHSDGARWNAAVFGYGEAGLEVRGSGRGQVAIGFGLGRLLNPDAVSSCIAGGDPDPCTDRDRRVHNVPFVTVAIGLGIFPWARP